MFIRHLWHFFTTLWHIFKVFVTNIQQGGPKAPLWKHGMVPLLTDAEVTESNNHGASWLQTCKLWTWRNFSCDSSDIQCHQNPRTSSDSRSYSWKLLCKTLHNLDLVHTNKVKNWDWKWLKVTLAFNMMGSTLGCQYAIFRNWLDTYLKMETHDSNVFPTILGGVSQVFWSPFLDWGHFLALENGHF